MGEDDQPRSSMQRKVDAFWELMRNERRNRDQESFDAEDDRAE